jgi:poly-gamma-glutamate synthesis protein (capsule biosynthesis protein)
MVKDMQEISLFVCGDVMTGRGIDQILPHPSHPQLFERHVRSALDYVALAERRSGPIPRPVAPAYIWGEALAVLDSMRPDVRLINLETAVTASDNAWPDKGIHYRMHPANIGALAALAPDCCVLANNHVLDWGRGGLCETLDVLHAAGILTAGAGRDLAEATRPACIVPGAKGTPDDGGDSALADASPVAAPPAPATVGPRVLVFAVAVQDSGVPPDWAATANRPGVAWLPDLAPAGAAALLDAVAAHRRPGDVVVVSIHWGANWVYRIPTEQRAFARRLVEGGVDLVHGHSSHHPLGIEVYRERLILHGCGDFLNDYEGIAGYAEFRPGVALMYFPVVDAYSGRLQRLTLVPTRTGRFRINRANDEETAWLQAMLNREGQPFGTRVAREGDVLRVSWR